MAQNCLAAGEKYILCTLTNWGSPRQKRQDIPFETLEAEYDMQHTGVRFRRKPRCAKDRRPVLLTTVNARAEPDPAGCVDRYAAVCHLPMRAASAHRRFQVLRRLSAVLDVAIDDLVQTYEVAEDE